MTLSDNDSDTIRHHKCTPLQWPTSLFNDFGEACRLSIYDTVNLRNYFEHFPLTFTTIS